MGGMENRAAVERTIAACIQNAEHLVAAAKASAQPGSYHIGYHLAALALEEIGKASLVHVNAIDAGRDEFHKRPIEWIDDRPRHSRCVTARLKPSPFKAIPAHASSPATPTFSCQPARSYHT